MNARAFFPVLLGMYLCVFVIHALIVGKTVYGDGIYYYSWVRSMVIDGDTDFTNEYRHFSVGSFTTEIGKSANKFGIGPALLWLPAFTHIHTIVRGNGYTLPYQFAVGIAGGLYTACGLVFISLALSNKFSRYASLFTVTALAYATNILYYGAIDTVNSHAAGFFVSSLIFYLLITQKAHFFMGILTGLLASTRFADILFLIPVLLNTPYKKFLPVLTGTAVGFLPQIAGWISVYGTPVINTYAFEGESFRLATPRIIEVLFSQGYGLLTVTPIIALSLYFLTRQKNRLTFSILLVFLAVLYTVASWGTYWQGASFGGRMFVSLLPFLSLGLAYAYTPLSKSINPLIIICVCAGINIYSLLSFLL